MIKVSKYGAWANLSDYEKIKAKGLYKYKVTEEYSFFIPDIKVRYQGQFFRLEKSVLTILKDYHWDGASGPAIDTESFMVPSMVHDALYQICACTKDKELRKKADTLLKEMLRQRGVSILRRNYVYLAVRLFGWKYV